MGKARKLDNSESTTHEDYLVNFSSTLASGSEQGFQTSTSVLDNAIRDLVGFYGGDEALEDFEIPDYTSALTKAENWTNTWLGDNALTQLSNNAIGSALSAAQYGANSTAQRDAENRLDKYTIGKLQKGKTKSPRESTKTSKKSSNDSTSDGSSLKTNTDFIEIETKDSGVKDLSNPGGFTITRVYPHNEDDTKNPPSTSKAFIEARDVKDPSNLTNEKGKSTFGDYTNSRASIDPLKKEDGEAIEPTNTEALNTGKSFIDAFPIEATAIDQKESGDLLEPDYKNVYKPEARSKVTVPEVDKPLQDTITHKEVGLKEELTYYKNNPEIKAKAPTLAVNPSKTSEGSGSIDLAEPETLTEPSGSNSTKFIAKSSTESVPADYTFSDRVSYVIDHYLGKTTVNGIKLTSIHKATSAMARTSSPMDGCNWLLFLKKGEEWKAVNFRFKSMETPDKVRNSQDVYYGDNVTTIPINGMTYETSFKVNLIVDRKLENLLKLMDAFGYRKEGSAYNLNALNSAKVITYDSMLLLLVPGWVFHDIFKAGDKEGFTRYTNMYKGGSLGGKAKDLAAVGISSFPAYTFRDPKVLSFKMPLDFDTSKNGGWEIEITMAYNFLFSGQSEVAGKNLGYFAALADTSAVDPVTRV